MTIIYKECRVLFGENGQFRVLQDGQQIGGDMRRKERIVRNRALPKWVLKALDSGKWVEVKEFVPKGDNANNFYLEVRGETITPTIKKEEKVESYKISDEYWYSAKVEARYQRSRKVYKDFEVGKKFSLTIDIINVSYVFNSFHPQPLDDEIIDFFEIDYQPCGRIPAGISTKMTLHFTPLVNKDYKSSLKLLSETGMCEIPIECYCKKCIINFEKKVIDYGNVIIGQEINIPLVVSNTGALNCKYTVVDNDKELLVEKTEEEEIDPFADLEASYKDYTDRSIILHKNDFIKDQEKCSEGLLDKIKVKRIEEYKIKALNEAKEAYEKEERDKEKEKEEQLNQPNNANKNNKAQPAKPPAKKPAGKDKDKEPTVELVEGIPKEKYDEVELKVKEYEKNFKIENEEDKKEYNNYLSINKFNSMKAFFLKQIKFQLYGQFNGYSKKNVSFILNARFIGEFSLKCYLKIEYKDKVEFKEFEIKFNIVDLPIYSEKKIYELNYIIINQIFREKIVLINKSPIPYKLQLFFHKDLSDYIELNPSLGYIQANSTFEVWLK